jgi:hypothetical protein
MKEVTMLVLLPALSPEASERTALCTPEKLPTT